MKRLFAKTVRTESIELSQVLVKVESNHGSIKEEIYFSDRKNSSQKKKTYVDRGYIRFNNNSNDRRFREKANTRKSNTQKANTGNRTHKTFIPFLANVTTILLCLQGVRMTKLRMIKNSMCGEVWLKEYVGTGYPKTVCLEKSG